MITHSLLNIFLKRTKFLLVFLIVLGFLLVLIFTAHHPIEKNSVNKTDDERHLRYLDDKEAVFSRLSKAIQFRTVSTGELPKDLHEQFKKFNDFLFSNYRKALSKLSLKFESESSLLFSLQGKSKELNPILLITHSDVVGTQFSAANFWEHPPFSGFIDETHIWGRGALDNKSAVLGVFEAIESLSAVDDWRPDRTIYIAVTHDEEVGGHKGAARIAKYLESQNIRPYFILDEGQAVTKGVIPNVTEPVALIGVTQKGYMTLELSAEGEGGHSMIPPKATAIAKLGKAISKLTESRLPPKMTGPIKGMFRQLSFHVDFPTNVMLYHTWLTEPIMNMSLERAPSTDALIKTSMSVNMISGGIAENVLPKRASALINYRIAPHNSSAEILEHVIKVIKDFDVKVRVVSHIEEPAPITNHESEAFALVSETISGSYPNAIIAPSITLSTTDSRHFINQTESIFRFSPIFLNKEDLPRFHGINERISKQNYLQMIDFYRLLLGSI